MFVHIVARIFTLNLAVKYFDKSSVIRFLHCEASCLITTTLPSFTVCPLKYIENSYDNLNHFHM